MAFVLDFVRKDVTTPVGLLKRTSPGQSLFKVFSRAQALASLSRASGRCGVPVRENDFAEALDFNLVALEHGMEWVPNGCLALGSPIFKSSPTGSISEDRLPGSRSRARL